MLEVTSIIISYDGKKQLAEFGKVVYSRKKQNSGNRILQNCHMSCSVKATHSLFLPYLYD
jgi:hypothetical protein